MKKIAVSLLLLALLLICPQVIKAEEGDVDSAYSIVNSQDDAMRIAELTLSQIADRNESRRKVTGLSLIAGGIGFAALGVLVDVPEVLPVFMVIGGTIAGSGALVLALPTSSEREYVKVMKATDPAEREYLAEKSLQYLAAKAHRERVISAACSGGMALYYLYELTMGDYEYDMDEPEGMEIYYVAGLAGSAIYQLLVPSYEENAYKEVMEKKYANVSWKVGEFTGLVASLKF